MWWKGPWEWFRHAQAEVFLKQSFLKELRSKLSFCGQIFTPGPKLSFFWIILAGEPPDWKSLGNRLGNSFVMIMIPKRREVFCLVNSSVSPLPAQTVVKSELPITTSRWKPCQQLLSSEYRQPRVIAEIFCNTKNLQTKFSLKLNRNYKFKMRHRNLMP